MIAIVLKRCARCRDTKPTGEFHCDAHSKDGLATYCKTCKCRQVEDRRTRIRSARTYVGVSEKKCATCHRTLPASRFYRSSGELDGLSYNCRPCVNRAARARVAKLKSVGPVPVSRKLCRSCGQLLGRDSFTKNCQTKDGLSGSCRECMAIVQASVQYAIPREEAAALRRRASCDICDRELSRHNRNIDHCHTSGDVRGVLCRNCNFMIGMSGDRPTVLEKAAEYLRAAGARRRSQKTA